MSTLFDNEVLTQAPVGPDETPLEGEAPTLFYPVPAEAESTLEPAPQLQEPGTIAGLSGHLVLQKIAPAHFSTGQVSFSTNDHRTSTNRLIPEIEPRIAPATAVLQIRDPRPVVFNSVAFGASRSEDDGLYVPEEPLAHKMNARLWIPTGMQVDHEGRPLTVAEKRQPSLGVILEEAKGQFDYMARKYPAHPITKEKAVDDIIRRSERIVREENVDPDVATARQRAEVPSTIDPVKLYERVSSGFDAAHPPAEDEVSSLESIRDKLRAHLESGKDPLRAHYEAAKGILVLAWNYRDQTESEATERGNAAIKHERSYMSALLEHRRELGSIATRPSAEIDGTSIKSRPTYTHY